MSIISALRTRLRNAWGLLPEKAKEAIRLIKLQKPVTALFGPLYTQPGKRIDLDITYQCSLRCLNCNQSCRQAPSQENMSMEQVEKFINESISQKRKWEAIRLMGGECTLHPLFLEILDKLLEYTHKFSPFTEIELVSNGFGPAVNAALEKVPKEVKVFNTKKQSERGAFDSFNVAPVDSQLFGFIEYANGCNQLVGCGMALNRYGYYPCGVGAGIDRVLGLNIGRKKLPLPNDSMAKELRQLCKYCGHFRKHIKDITVTEETMSPTWRKAYEEYKRKKPFLTLY